MLRPWARLKLQLLQARDRARLRELSRLHPGLRIHPSASTNLAAARFELAPGARLEIGANVFTERLPGELCFQVEADASIVVGEGTWLRGAVQRTHLSAYPGATLSIGKDCWFNGCQLAARERVEIGEGGMIGPGARVYDSEHALDEDRPARVGPVRVGDFTWIGSDATVLCGSEIGSHCVIGAGSLVNGRIEDHSLAVGTPAQVRGRVGTRRAFM